MTDVIEKWLLNSIGVNISLSSSAIGKACFDGTLFAKILLKYNICSPEYLNYISTRKSVVAAHNNLKQLSIWFRILQIPFDDESLKQIAQGHSAPALRLLYELFLKLEDKENVRLIDEKKKEILLTESTDKFVVQKVAEPQPEREMSDDKEFMIDAIRNGQDVIELYLKKERNFMDYCLQESRKRRAAIKEELTKNLQLFNTEVTGSDGKLTTLEKDVDIFKGIKDIDRNLNKLKRKVDIRGVESCNPKEFISSLKDSRRKKEIRKIWREKNAKDTLDEAWKDIFMKNDEESREFLTKKLLKQAEPEKEMIVRLKRSRQLYKTFFENRKVILEAEERGNLNRKFLESFRSSADENLNIIEHTMIQELQDTLQSEKNRMKHETNLKECRNILNDIIDLAIVNYEYKLALKTEPSKKKIVSWKLLFILGIPLFVCQDEDAGGQNHLRIEDKRSEILAEYEFHLYNCLIGPWSLKSFEKTRKCFRRCRRKCKRKCRCGCKFSSSMEEPNDLLRIGNIVHRLLDLKYPYSKSFGTPPDLEHYPVQVLLRPVKCPYIVKGLKNLLEKANIAIVDVNAATNYVIDAYKKYTKEIYCPANATKEPKVSAKEKDLSCSVINEDGTIKREEQIKLLKKRTFIDLMDVGVKYEDAKVQVPEDIKNTLPREVALGNIVNHHLSKGLLLSDIITCEILLEYIKSLKGIKGWVLLNFPNNLKQLAIMGYLFSAREVQFMQAFTDNIYLKLKSEFKFIDEPIPDEKVTNLGQNYTPAEELLIRLSHPSMTDIAFWKRSSILPKCSQKTEFPQYKSIFSRVLRLEFCRQDELSDTEVLEGNSFMDVHDAEDSPLFSKSVEDFYEGLKILVRFPIQKLNHKTLTTLAREIMNEPPNEWCSGWKNDVDLFGFEKVVHTKPEPLHKQTIHAGTRKTNFSELFQGPVYFRPKLELLTKEVYRVKIKRDKKEATRTENDKAGDSALFVQVGKPNKENSISKVYYEPLASIWESTEFFYTFNMTETLYSLSQIDSQFIPYRNFVVKKAKQCIDLNDDRKRIVSNFQLMLNSVSDNLRQVKTMKNELHYRVRGLQKELWKMSNVKQILSNDILRRLVKEHWLPKQLCNYINCYTRLIQVEVDRFVYTMQLITDYYSVCTTEDISYQKPSKIFLPKFEFEKSDSRKTLKQKSSTKQSQRYSSKLSKSGKLPLKRQSKQGEKLAKQSKPRPLRKNDLEEPAVVNCASSLEKRCEIAIRLLSDLLGRVRIRAFVINDSHKKISRETCTKQTGGVSNIRKSSVTSEQEDFLQWQQFQEESIYNDWAETLQEETDRLLFRLGLIEAHAKKTMSAQINIIKSAFEYFKLQVLDRYHKECLNIDKLCDLLRIAIEEEVKIQPSIILDGDQFYVDPDKLMYPSPPPPEPRALEEIALGNQMTAVQLTNFHHKMSYIAPLGLLKNIFIDILQGMASLGLELGYPYLPRIWSSLDASFINDLINEWFGNKSVISWKDFIIFSLDYTYPSLEEILSMKEQFEAHDPEHSELITKEQFMSSLLWLDNRRTLGLEQTLRRVKLKELLFELFQVNVKQMNYTCFLLSICRDVNPKVGLVKALAATDGLLIVSWSRHLLHDPDDVGHENDKYDISKSILLEIIQRVYAIEDIKIRDRIDENEIDLHQFLPKYGNPRISHDLPVENTDKSLREEMTNSAEPESSKHSITFDWSSFLTKFKSGEDLMNYEVHFDKVLSIFIFYLQYYAVDPDHLYQHLALEKNLNRIFSERGDGYTIKLQVLLDDEFIENFLISYKIFSAINITQYLNLLYKTESTIANEYIMK